jgi:L-ascorbate metabolism protein UlaG (beta-lactamase superfamily)
MREYSVKIKGFHMTRRKLLSLLASGALFAWFFKPQKLYSGAISDHFDGKIFFDKDGMPAKSLLDVAKWNYEGIKLKQPWPENVAVVQSKPPARSEKLLVTFIGHASWLYQMDGVNILVDPVYAERVSPVSFAGPKRVCQPGVAFDDLPPIDTIIVTHNHYDHMDSVTLEKLVAKHGCEIITPLGNDAYIKAKTMDWGDKTTLKNDITLHCEPCRHWSARGLFDRNKALWACFVFETKAGRILHIGDTGYGTGAHFHRLKAKFKGFDLAILPIGAYEPRWFMRDQHVNPAESLQIMKDVQAKTALASHWGTFALADESRDAPVDALKATGVENFKILNVGENYLGAGA